MLALEVFELFAQIFQLILALEAFEFFAQLFDLLRFIGLSRRRRRSLSRGRFLVLLV
jgi:hypothetical protein